MEGKGEDWRAGEEGCGHMSLMGDAQAHPSSALLQDSVSPPVKWLVKGPIRLREPVQGQRREESQEPRCHIFSQLPLLSSCLPDSGQGRGKGSQGWGPPRARYPGSAAPSARRELTRSLGIYHAPNYNVNWQVPEIN